MSFSLLVEDFFPISGRGYIFVGSSQGSIRIGDTVTLENTDIEWMVKGTDILAAYSIENKVLNNLGVLIDIGELAPSFLIGKRLLRVDHN